jgi:hypothetical protein
MIRHGKWISLDYDYPIGWIPSMGEGGFLARIQAVGVRPGQEWPREWPGHGQCAAGASMRTIGARCVASTRAVRGQCAAGARRGCPAGGLPWSGRAGEDRARCTAGAVFGDGGADGGWRRLSPRLRARGMSSVQVRTGRVTYGFVLCLSNLLKYRQYYLCFSLPICVSL